VLLYCEDDLGFMCKLPPGNNSKFLFGGAVMMMLESLIVFVDEVK
jgi:hypothetical protein